MVAATRPSGTVTFLFSNIESPSRLWEDSPEEMAAALQIHDAVAHKAIEDRAGYVFAGGDDGLGAAFSTAPDAVGAAVEIQRNMAAHGDAIPFSVRTVSTPARRRKETATTSVPRWTAPPG